MKSSFIFGFQQCFLLMQINRLMITFYNIKVIHIEVIQHISNNKINT